MSRDEAYAEMEKGKTVECVEGKESGLMARLTSKQRADPQNTEHQFKLPGEDRFYSTGLCFITYPGYANCRFVVVEEPLSGDCFGYSNIRDKSETKEPLDPVCEWCDSHYEHAAQCSHHRGNPDFLHCVRMKAELEASKLEPYPLTPGEAITVMLAGKITESNDPKYRYRISGELQYRINSKENTWRGVSATTCFFRHKFRIVEPVETFKNVCAIGNMLFSIALEDETPKKVLFGSENFSIEEYKSLRDQIDAVIEEESK
jgi:hypothetical protein